MGSWTVGKSIRSRREEKKLSLDKLAEELGVSKAYLSYVEKDLRPLSTALAEKLQEILGIPTDLLLVGSGKLPEDVKSKIEADPAWVTRTMRSQQGALDVEGGNQHFSALTIKEDLRGKTNYIHNAIQNIPKRVIVSKGSSEYRAHSYHTKVPPEAIKPFIELFTEKGETVLDPFCGSGMTGVAALQKGRNAVLSDLSPAACHIAKNYTEHCDPDALSDALLQLEQLTKPIFTWLYRPLGAAYDVIEYTTWTDEFECNHCSATFRYFDAVLDEGGGLRSETICPKCGDAIEKRNLKWKGESPAITSYKGARSRIESHATTERELALIEEIDAAPIPYWIPDLPFDRTWEMWRSSHEDLGINNVKGFFTRRNLYALAALRHFIMTEFTGRIKEALLFSLTACINRASKRYQWNHKRPTNVMTGTLYVSSLRYEWNVWSLFKRKARDVIRYYRNNEEFNSKVMVYNHSATQLRTISDNSISFVFMDPPFGSNIFYADSSLLWEAWLGTLTDRKQELVINKSINRTGCGNDLEIYETLMANAFKEVSRVLPKSKYAVLAFSNSDDKVWVAIQNALASAGLRTRSVSLLNKGQASIKGVKGRSGKEKVTTLDLLVTLENTKTPFKLADEENQNLKGRIKTEVRKALSETPKLLDEIYSEVLQSTLAQGILVHGITLRSVEAYCKELGAEKKSGKWSLKTSRFNFTDFYTVNESDLPISDGNPKFVESVPTEKRIKGSRSSVFYNAHSYHTKVPPESITPFIEHFTKPGGVVLDPFCGSGMTGVAASLSGRQSILNDLSPAAIHLAWNHSRECNTEALIYEIHKIENNLEQLFQELYSVKHDDFQDGIAEWIMWSSIHDCPECQKEFSLWSAVGQQDGTVGKEISCPNCHKSINRRSLRNKTSQPAWISYRTEDGKRHERPANKRDVDKAFSFSKQNITFKYPEESFSQDREMYVRCALQLKGIEKLSDFYTPRNLIALSAVWSEILNVHDLRIRAALAFAFTNSAWHATRMRRYNARGGQRPMTGTLYIPQLSSEANVLSLMKNKIKQLVRYYSHVNGMMKCQPSLLNGSADRLKAIKDGSIDYIFTDPPFGSNIFYADCNFIWESWLGRLTEMDKEAVINKSIKRLPSSKTIEDYEGIMEASFKEMYRVLVPGAWATIVFHNTDAKVWQAIHDGAFRAGFEFHEASSLFRAQQSHKGYKGRSGKEKVAHFDVIMNLKKPENKKFVAAHSEITLDEIIADIAESQDSADWSTQMVHAEVMRILSSKRSQQFYSYEDIEKKWRLLKNNI